MIQKISTSFNYAAYVLAMAETTPDKVALEIIGHSQVVRWSFREIASAANGVATGLRQLGYRPGARVLLRLTNRVEFPLAYLGCILAGAIPVPTSAQLTVPEISRIGSQLKPDLIISEPNVALPDPANCAVMSVDTLRLMYALPAGLPEMGDSDRLAYIIFTSGTSGQAKGVCHAHRAIWARRMMWDGWYGLRSNDRVLHAGAFNWTYTLGTGLMDPWSIGATALIPAPGITPDQLPHLIVEHDATIFAAAPGIYRQMLRSVDGIDAPSLRHGLSAGEKMSAQTALQWRNTTGRDVHEALGMSEVSTFISGSPTRPAPPGSSGYPQKGRKIAVLSEEMKPVPPGQVGRLAVSTKDPGLMLGYLDAPALNGDWFITGDNVMQSPDGAITYLGRSDDMMNAGGFRVSPLEVEQAFADIDTIQDAAATSVEIKPGTFVIALFFVAADEVKTNILRAHAQATLAHYKQPRLYIPVSDLPKGANGKLNRRTLSQQYEARL